MCFSVILTPKWVLVTACKIKALGNDFLGILMENVPKLGPQWQGAEVPKTSLFLIGLPVFPALHLVYPALHLFWPNGAKTNPIMIPGDPTIRVFRSTTATQICATLGTVSTLNVASCSLLACFLLPCSTQINVSTQHKTNDYICYNPKRGGGVGRQPIGYIYIYIYYRVPGHGAW